MLKVYLALEGEAEKKDEEFFGRPAFLTVRNSAEQPRRMLMEKRGLDKIHNANVRSSLTDVI